MRREACRDRKSRSESGFTLLELMVVLVVILIVSALGFPAFQRMIHRARLTGYVQTVSIELSRARQQAVRRGVPVVAQPRFDSGDLFVYANVDLDSAFDFNPDPTATEGTVDYEIVTLPLPVTTSVNFWGPSDGGPNGGDAVDGLTPMSVGPNAVVFEPDGGVQDVGGIRIADARGNFLEVRVEPAATGRVQVLKYNRAPSWGDPDDFYPPGHEETSGNNMWVWY